MNAVVDQLRRDHLNCANLLYFVARQAEQGDRGDEIDLEALIEVVDYLSDYHAQHHHPLEDALCARMNLVRPGIAETITDLLSEHQETGTRLLQFKRLIASAIDRRELPSETLISAANILVQAEMQHMARENVRLFPEALSVLKFADWTLLEAAVPRPQAPFVGPTPAARFDNFRKLSAG